jgi:predicted TIM-barrel fold metal-dependent hydrolase
VNLFESAYHIHRVRICGEWKFRMLFDDGRCLALFRKAGELKCPVVLHLDAPELAGVPQKSWFGGTVENLERALQLCPDTIFIGHAPGFWRYISGDATTDPTPYPNGPITPGGEIFRLFDSYPNLYADLSAGSGLTALRRDVAHGRDFASKYADRLLFGRDYYGGALLNFLKRLDLPRDVSDKIYFRNAQKLVPNITPNPPLLRAL